MKAMAYTKHEFVKTSEVALLVQEAMQSVMDKFAQRDQAINQQKAQTKAME